MSMIRAIESSQVIVKVQFSFCMSDQSHCKDKCSPVKHKMHYLIIISCMHYQLSGSYIFWGIFYQKTSQTSRDMAHSYT